MLLQRTAIPYSEKYRLLPSIGILDWWHLACCRFFLIALVWVYTPFHKLRRPMFILPVKKDTMSVSEKLPVSLFAPLLLDSDYIRDLPIQLIFSVLKSRSINHHKPTALNPDLRAEAGRQFNEQRLRMGGNFNRIQVLPSRLQDPCYHMICF